MSATINAVDNTKTIAANGDKASIGIGVIT